MLDSFPKAHHLIGFVSCDYSILAMPKRQSGQYLHQALPDCFDLFQKLKFEKSVALHTRHKYY